VTVVLSASQLERKIREVVRSHSFSLADEIEWSLSRLFIVGNQLNISDDELFRIRSEYGPDDGRCFEECIIRWLRRIDTTDSCNYWRLIEALQIVGEFDLANSLIAVFY
jgi:hypothetical protein